MSENKVIANILPPASTCDSGISMKVDLFNDRFTSFQLDIERKIENLIDDKLSQKQVGRYPVGESKSIRMQQQETPDRLDDNRERNIVTGRRN